MFPFGSFITEIPLILLAFAYMLFFGTYALNKGKSGNVSEIVNDKEAHVKYSSGASFNYASYYQQDASENEVVMPEKPNITFPSEHLKSSLKHIPDNIPYCHLCEFALFSRPPPSLG